MKVKEIIATVLYIIFGVAFVVAMVLAISTAFNAPFALSLERFVIVDMAYYDFDLLDVSQKVMIGTAALMIIVLVILDERASRIVKGRRR